MKKQLQLAEAKLLITEIEKTNISNEGGLFKIEELKKRLEIIISNQDLEGQSEIKTLLVPSISKLKAASHVGTLKAIDRLLLFSDESVNSPYKKIKKEDFIIGVIERVEAPDKFNQCTLNVCGPAAYCFLWAKFDPLGFTNAAIDLYEKGAYSYNKMLVKANEDVFKQNVTPGVNVVDWMILSAIRHSENALLDYNPEKNSGISAFTSHWEMTDWISSIIGVSEERDAHPTIAKINDAIKAKKMIVLLVDWAQLSNNLTKKASKLANLPESFINAMTGNHYVIIEKPIHVIDNFLEFSVWTWGRDKSIKLDKNKFQSAVKSMFVASEILY